MTRLRSIAVVLAGLWTIGVAGPLRAAPEQSRADETPPEGAPATAQLSDQDRALIRALVTAFDPWAVSQERQAALADPTLTDPRAAGPLTFLLRDADAGVRAAAARALAPFASLPRVSGALIRLLETHAQPLEVRVAAAESLARGDAAAGEALYRIHEDDREDLPLRQAARGALARGFPHLLRERGTAEMVDRRGRSLFTVGSGFLGSYALAAVGTLGQNEAGITIGLLGGALLGSGSAYLLTRAGEITHAQAGWMVSAGAWGAGLGMLTAATASSDPSARLVLGLGLVGESVGFAAAFATRRAMGFSGGDIAVINWGGVLGLDLALGSLMMFDEGARQTATGVLLGSAAAGLGVGAALAPRLSFSRGDVLITADSAYEGMMLGWLTAAALDAESNRVGGGAVLGLGAGFVGGAALAQVSDIPPADAVYVLAVGTYGKLLGLSVPLLADAGDRAVAAGTIVGSVVSLGAAHATAGKLSFTASAPLFIGLSTGYGFWHGYALGRSANGLSSRQQDGAMWLGTALGGIAAAPIDLRLQLSTTEVLAVAGGAFWGSWFSAWGAALADASRSNRLRLTLVAGDLGIIVSALAISPLIDVDPRRLGVINVAGLAGAGVASLAAALATKNNDTVIAANLIGSGVGLVGGAVVAAAIDFSPRGRPASASAGSHGRPTSSIAPAPIVYPLVMPADPRQGPGVPPAVGIGLAFFD